jgi:K+-sensing histidine kinase KdpD
MHTGVRWLEATDARQAAARPRPETARRAGVREHALAAAGLVALTAAMSLLGDRLDPDNVLLLYLSSVVVVAIVLGLPAALVTAVVTFLAAVLLFGPPSAEVDLAQHDHVIELLIFLAVAVVVSLVADARRRHRHTADRHRLEAQLLSELAAVRADRTGITAVLTRLRDGLGVDWLRLVRTHDAPPGERQDQRSDRTPPHASEEVVAHAGDPPDLVGAEAAGSVASVDTDHGLRLDVGADPAVLAANTRLWHAAADTVAHAWQEQQLADEIARARELAEIDRVRRGLLAAVSHDLRTPLAGIKANAAALRHHVPGLDVRQEPSGVVPDDLLSAVEAASDHLTEMVSNLLSMSRIEAGALSAHIAPVPLYEVVSRAFVTIDDSRTDIDVPEDLPLVLTDPTLLERIVTNLVRNAHQHALADPGSGTEGEGRITVRAESTGSEVRLEVVDHGPGVPEDRWDQVFRPFQRLNDTGRGKGDGAGAGLGLAIARGFSNAVGATLTPSRTPGGGLTMSLTLPTSGPPARAGQAAEPAGRAGS